jgi:hypothetical protein
MPFRSSKPAGIQANFEEKQIFDIENLYQTNLISRGVLEETKALILGRRTRLLIIRNLQREDNRQ